MDKIADFLTGYYIRKNVISKDMAEIYCYGFKLIIADIINFSIIIMLGILFSRIIDSIVFLITLCGLRQFCGGFHAKTFWLCRLSMICTYCGVIILTNIISSYTGIWLGVTITLNIIAIIFIYVFAPIEHPNKPLSAEQKRNNRVKSIITSCILSIISISFVAMRIKLGVTISITLTAVVFFMLVSMVLKEGGK